MAEVLLFSFALVRRTLGIFIMTLTIPINEFHGFPQPLFK
jgi:hypothetical protein